MRIVRNSRRLIHSKKITSSILQFRITHGFVIRNELLITRIYERVKYRQLFLYRI